MKKTKEKSIQEKHIHDITNIFDNLSHNLVGSIQENTVKPVSIEAKLPMNIGAESITAKLAMNTESESITAKLAMNTESESITPKLPTLPELEELIDKFLLNNLFLYNLQNTYFTLNSVNKTRTTAANSNILKPKPKYPEPKYPEIDNNSDNSDNSDNYYSDLEDYSSEEDRVITWLSNVELPSQARAIRFFNTHHKPKNMSIKINRIKKKK